MTGALNRPLIGFGSQGKASRERGTKNKVRSAFSGLQFSGTHSERTNKEKEKEAKPEVFGEGRTLSPACFYNYICFNVME